MDRRRTLPKGASLPVLLNPSNVALDPASGEPRFRVTWAITDDSAKPEGSPEWVVDGSVLEAGGRAGLLFTVVLPGARTRFARAAHHGVRPGCRHERERVRGNDQPLHRTRQRRGFAKGSSVGVGTGCASRRRNSRSPTWIEHGSRERHGSPVRAHSVAPSDSRSSSSAPASG